MQLEWRIVYPLKYVFEERKGINSFNPEIDAFFSIKGGQEGLTRSRSQVEGSRINGRIRIFPFDFSTLLVILQNTMIPVSYILKYTMKKYENPRFLWF